MKHIAFAVVAAAALAIIGPHISQDNSQAKETAAAHATAIPPADRATPLHSHAAPGGEFPKALDKG